MKITPKLYKLRIAKKKTGLPNTDYPPIILNNKIKDCNLTVLSIEYDEIHIENNVKKIENSYNQDESVDTNYFFDKEEGDLNKKFLENTFSSNYETGRIKNSKKCCKCLIF